ncbi:class I SAM-dependent methyltransferase [Legionella jordanis]|uniref:O-methyltransferase n=1 Tax=Legionella jordanis TaxID=456 RepID=A0A0W0VGL9_9GAMM|nr:class I SAM-dependent methyltransferase [Legionella jordanis]KTD19021.1 O-methyltransferase [Legionella jordanis]RMX05420.1 methyltransferase domain-containing protein [Legionella jordanis]RMX19102.1 methyltransferase domain-containing protein [Legionella jordanis]VEH13123.1 O-methyltransferase [Legionella jordanis]HAT8714783.1 methyltransferase domain-containing protein [Legionella jordanis]
MKHLNLTPALYDYMLDVSLREHPVLQALRQETAKLPLGMMQVSPEQAQFMQFMLRAIGARTVLEVGTFTGYSALAMALALPEDGKVITCDINVEWTSKAHPFWREAQQDKKIELRLAPALNSLQNLLAEGYAQTFDFIFIDADKTNYVNYYELALQLIQPQGIIAIDNIFWDGHVIDEQDHGAQTREIRRLNQLIKEDERVDVSLLAIADGLFLLRPRSK